MNKKAIGARGWGPMNYYILDDEETKKTMVSSDPRKAYTEVFGRHYGEPVPVSDELQEIEHDTVTMATHSPQSVIGVNDMIFSRGLGKWVMDDLLTGDQAKKHRAAIRDRARVNNDNVAAMEAAKKNMFASGLIGGKTCGCVSYSPVRVGSPGKDGSYVLTPHVTP